MVPKPSLVKPPVPVITPAKVVEALFPPVCKPELPIGTLLPALPANEPIVSRMPFKSNTPELLTVTAELSAI